MTAEEVDINSLAEDYNEIRRTQRGGDARTAAMTGVVRRMIDLAPRTKGFDLTATLRESNRGLRLFAYAYLYARPDSRVLLAPERVNDFGTPDVMRLESARV